MNPETLSGWGVRENDWQWGVTVQQEVMSRVSVEVGYARRWFKGVTVTDNRTGRRISTSGRRDGAGRFASAGRRRLPDYPLPGDERGAGYAASNYITFQTDFGPERTNYWHGVDFTLNARTRWGLTFSGGTSTGRSVRTSARRTVLIDARVGSVRDPRNCHDADPFQTTLRGLASYTIPKIDVLVSGTVRSQPEVERVANRNLPNSPTSAACVPNPAACTTLQGLLGRLPTGVTATGTQTIDLIDNDHRLYSGERRTQVDLRFAKIVRFGATRADIGVDLANLLNTNYATTYENTYQYRIGDAGQGGTWNNPTAIYGPRFVRLNFTVELLAKRQQSSGAGKAPSNPGPGGGSDLPEDPPPFLLRPPPPFLVPFRALTDQRSRPPTIRPAPPPTPPPPSPPPPPPPCARRAAAATAPAPGLNRASGARPPALPRWPRRFAAAGRRPAPGSDTRRR